MGPLATWGLGLPPSLAARFSFARGDGLAGQRAAEVIDPRATADQMPSSSARLEVSAAGGRQEERSVDDLIDQSVDDDQASWFVKPSARVEADTRLVLLAIF